MYEDDEFARSLGVAPEPQIFTPDDSDMMNMIFHYLETDGAVKQVEPKITPRLDIDPTTGDFQRYGDYRGSQEFSPSPTASLFSESHTVSRASGLTTPRTLSNSSLRSQSKTEGLRMTTNPTSNQLAIPPKIPIPQSFDNGSAPERTQSPLVSPTATTNTRNVEYINPQEKRKSSYGELFAAIAGKYERRGSKEKSYRHTTQLASGERLNELEELGQAIMPSTYTPFVYAPAPKAKPSNAPLQWPSQQVPDNTSARSHESKTSQSSFNAYRSNLSALSESNSYNTENKSPSTFQQINHPHPPPTDPGLRRYDSFKTSPNTGRFEPKDSHKLPIYEGTTKGLDTLISPRASIRSKFSFPKPLRATITSFMDSMPHALPSPTVSHTEQSVSLPKQLQISTPQFNTPPRPAPQIFPALLSVGYKDTKTATPPLLGGTPKRSFSGRSSAPSLTIQIPESKRPVPLKVENGLTDALEKFKQDSKFTRPPKIPLHSESPAMPSRPAPLAPIHSQPKASHIQPPPKSPKRYQLEDITNTYNNTVHTQSQTNNYAVQAPVLTEKSLARPKYRLEPLVPKPLTTGSKSSSSNAQPSLALTTFKNAFLTPSTGLSLILSRHASSLSSLSWSISSTLKSPSNNLSITTYPHSLTRSSTFSTTSPSSSLNSNSSLKNEPLFTLQRKWGSTRVAETNLGEQVFSVRDVGFGDTLLFLVDFGKEKENSERERWVVRGDAGDGQGKGVEVVCEGRSVGRIGVVGNLKGLEGGRGGHDVS